MADKEEISAIIIECGKNSRKAQEKLFKRFYGKMLFVCLRYFPDRDTAQEVVQEGFIKVFDKIATFDQYGSIESWIRRIMVNTAIDQIRKNKRVQFVELNENINENDREDEFENNFDENINLALQCMDKLPPAYKAVFNLFYMEDLTHKEIAEKLGVSEGTSKSNLSKAKLKMQQLFAQKRINE